MPWMQGCANNPVPDLFVSVGRQSGLALPRSWRITRCAIRERRNGNSRTGNGSPILFELQSSFREVPVSMDVRLTLGRRRLLLLPRSFREVPGPLELRPPSTRAIRHLQETLPTDCELKVTPPPYGRCFNLTTLGPQFVHVIVIKIDSHAHHRNRRPLRPRPNPNPRPIPLAFPTRQRKPRRLP